MDEGFFGAAMAGVTEIAYTGLVDTLNALEPKFRVRADFQERIDGTRAVVGSTAR